TVHVGPGVARREIDHAELGVDARRLPDRRAAVLPRIVVPRPRRMADLAGARDRIEVPDPLAGLRVVRADPAADAELAAGEADDDHAVVVERRGGDAIAFARIAGEHVPYDGAGSLIERDQPAVEPSEKDHAVAEADAAAQPSAADARRVEIDVRFVDPVKPAGLDVDGEDVVVAGD